MLKKDTYLIRAISTSETISNASADLILNSASERFCFNLTKSATDVFFNFANVCLTTNSCCPVNFDNSKVPYGYKFVSLELLNANGYVARVSTTDGNNNGYSSILTQLDGQFNYDFIKCYFCKAL